jgi:hypothetical protein
MTLLLLLLSSFIIFMPHDQGQAATDIYVDDDTCPATGSGTVADPFCRVYDAVGSSSAGDTVIIAQGTYDESIECFVTKDLSIVGAGSPYVLIQGNGVSGVLRIDAGITVTLSGATIQGAGASAINNLGTLDLIDVIVTGNSTDGSGGGIHNSGDLTIANSLITNNSLISTGHGAGIFNSGNLTITNSEVSTNSAPVSDSTGGGICNLGGTLVIDDSAIHNNDASYLGGGIYSSGSVELTNMSIFYNHATAAYSFGGGLHNTGSATLRNVTISGNSAQSAGGGVWNVNVSASLVNVTVSGNSAPYGGGIAHQASSASQLLTIHNSTIAENNANFGGGASGIDSYGPVDIENSILAANLGGGNCIEWTVYPITSLGYNLEDADTCGFASTGDLPNTDPQLLSLLHNGGFTETHALPAGSPALDAGDPAGCEDELGIPLLTDQRGFPRPMDGDVDGTAVCDIGAYEFQPFELFLPLIMR